MFNQYDALKREIEALKKEIQTLKDDQIKQNRDYKDAIYNLDSDNLPALQGLVKEINLRLKDGDVNASFVMNRVNDESAAKIEADRIKLEGSKFEASLSDSITLSVKNELDVGGRNWLFNSGFTNVAQQYFKAGNGANIDSIDDGQWWVQPDESYVTIVEHEGSTCARIIGKKDQTCWLSQNIYHLFAVNSLEQQYTFSADIKLDITSKGNNHYIMLEAGPYKHSGQMDTTFQHRLEDYAGKGWIRVSFTFSLADIPLADWGVTDASQISISKLLKYVNFCVYARDFEGNLYFKNIQLEKGNIATEWTPAPEDMVEQGRIITAINMTKDSAKISAEKLDIEGKQLDIWVDAANITGTLTVKEADGDVLLSAGDGVVKIGGWKVDNNSLWTGDSFSAKNSVFLCRGSIGSGISIAGSPKKTGWIIKAGENFGVDKEGEAYFSKAHIRRGCVIGEDIEEGEGVQLGPAYDDENATSRTDIYLEQNEDPLSGGYSRGANISSVLIRGNNVAIEHDDIKAMSGDVVIEPFKLGSSMSTIKVEDNLMKEEKGFVGLERSCTAANASDENMTAIMRVGEHALWINDKGELCTTAKALLTEQQIKGVNNEYF